MKQLRNAVWVVLLLVVGSIWFVHQAAAQETFQDSGVQTVITGFIHDHQDQPIAGVDVALASGVDSKAIAQTKTQSDGRYSLVLPDSFSSLPETSQYQVSIQRPHFQSTSLSLDTTQVQELKAGQSLTMPDVTMLRRIDLSFWIATLVFISMLVLIATAKLHNTLSALVGAVVLFAVSYFGRPIAETLYIFDFPSALSYVDWNVIFLILGMMIVIAVIERTGIFQWLAFTAYRISGGRTWLLLIILMIITGVTSAFLDNVTTMLLMTPITVQVALSLGIGPLALLMPEVMASNVFGISTLIGTPTNILIGSYAGISFDKFLTNLTPGVIMAMVGLAIYSLIIYRQELLAKSDDGVSSTLIEKLEERAKITQPEHLKKAGWVGLGMFILFIFGERLSLLPSVTALMGATALLVWIRPDIEEMIEAVDWTTLVFFIALFINVGAIEEVGLISIIADGIGNLVGTNLVLAIFIVIWFGAILSTIIPNIPFTAAMLPVIGYLTATIPGADQKVLFYSLAVGSAMGGNGSLIGASANMVTAGIAERAGYHISYVYFLKKGFPALLITVSLATIWILIRFL
ncbi:MAG: SLC13 family permease [Anaerolineales bacterium]